jgi:hypothetical protein
MGFCFIQVPSKTGFTVFFIYHICRGGIDIAVVAGRGLGDQSVIRGSGRYYSVCWCIQTHRGPSSLLPTQWVFPEPYMVWTGTDLSSVYRTEVKECLAKDLHTSKCCYCLVLLLKDRNTPVVLVTLFLNGKYCISVCVHARTCVWERERVSELRTRCLMMEVWWQSTVIDDGGRWRNVLFNNSVRCKDCVALVVSEQNLLGWHRPIVYF